MLPFEENVCFNNNYRERVPLYKCDAEARALTEIWTDVRLTYYTSFIWDVLRHVTQFDESQARDRRAGEYLKRTIKKWLSLTIISTAAYTHFSVLLAMVILQTSSKHWETVLSVALFKIFKYVTVIFL